MPSNYERYLLALWLPLGLGQPNLAARPRVAYYRLKETAGRVSCKVLRNAVAIAATEVLLVRLR